MLVVDYEKKNDGFDIVNEFLYSWSHFFFKTCLKGFQYFLK